MTSLRDARLKKALDSAPDWHIALSESIGDAIKKEALKALQPAPVVAKPGLPGRLKAWLFPPGNMPWNAAFASLLLASFVTLLWRDEAVPEAAPEATPPVTRIEPPAAVQPQQGAAPTAPKAAMDAKTLATPPAESRRRSEEAAPSRAPEKPAPLPDDMQQRGVTVGVQMAEKTEKAEAQAPLPALAVPVPSPAPSPAPLASGMAASPAPPASLAPPVAAAAMARAARPALLADQAKPSPPLSAVDGWTEARVVDGGRVLVLRRPALPQLAAWVGQLVQAASGQDGLPGQPGLQIELLRGAEPIGLLELADPWVRWTANGQASRTGVADAAGLRELRQLIGNTPANP